MKLIPFAKPDIREEDIETVAQVLRSGRLTDGPQVARLERLFSVLVGGGYAVAVSSCWAAMVLAYKALSTPGWDREKAKVLCPAMSHVATALAIEAIGAHPVFVDCELQTGCIDMSRLTESVDRETVAVAPMHYCGNPCQMDVLEEIAKEMHLGIFEDCATAMGALIGNTSVGTFGVGSFSLYPSKHIGIGEGGLLVVQTEKMAETVKRMRGFGLFKTGEVTYDMMSGDGGNYRLTEMQAALACAQLRRLPENLAHRRKIASLLIPQLAELGFQPIVPTRAHEQSAFVCLSALLPDALDNREWFVRKMRELGVELSVYYPIVIPAMAYFRQHGYTSMQFPHARRIAARSVAFPVGLHVGEEDVEQMMRAVKELL